MLKSNGYQHDLLLFQKGVVIIDSPGLGESDDMDQVLMNYLPNAFAFMYVINVTNAGGLQKDLKDKVNIENLNMEYTFKMNEQKRQNVIHLKRILQNNTHITLTNA